MIDAAADMTAASADLAATARDRLYRMLLYELQTAGGLSLECLSGEPLGPDSGRARSLVDQIHGTVRKLTDLATDAPQRATTVLCRDQSPARILDLGAGRAPWSLAIAAQHPDVRVTALDLPEQIPALRAAVATAGLAYQFHFAGLDLFHATTQSFPCFDLVIAANVCHLYEQARAKDVIAQAAQMLRHGGTLAVIDQMLNDAPDWARWSALYAVGALHAAPGGYLYTVGEYRRWLQQCSIERLNVYRLCPVPPLMLLTGARIASASPGCTPVPGTSHRDVPDPASRHTAQRSPPAATVRRGCGGSS